ncbi:restriction endonuclease subunit S [Phosphitispora sp. TUW77]|uniref:restriction endonuclease subunit S n=1 Tax=Phosphitispora sp. TUW77 TaxID=3152361 RepID=UPI002A451038|nr:restriction endonuclease subunit S [Massilibacteroides sp.]MDD3995161.1 restriction endonuclease subunit S [Bacilli bacterium]
MDKEKLLPSLRFSGYKDTWERNKLEHYLNVSNEKNTEGIFGKEDVLSVSGDFGIINQIEFHGRSFAGVSTANYGVVNTGDVVYTKSPLKANPFGIIKTNKGPAGIVSTLYAVYHPKENVYPDFIQVYFEQYARMNQYMHPLVNKGAKNDMKVSDANALKGDVVFPKVDEEKKIVEYFMNIDRLITLHQKEYDKLLIMKKAMLEKMFPKNGNKVPEVRFSEFDGAWGYRKLGTISDKVTEKNVYMEYTETLTNSAEYGIISQRDFFDHDIAKQDKINGYYVVRPEDFVYNPRISTTAPVGPIGRNKLGRCGVISPLYTVFRPKEVDNTFLEQFFKSSHWYSFMRFNGDTGARSDRFSIKDTTFFEMPIPFPKLNEQRRIGQYLAGLDVLISLQDKKLTKLKNIKAGCLEKMFV